MYPTEVYCHGYIEYTCTDKCEKCFLWIYPLFSKLPQAIYQCLNTLPKHLHLSPCCAFHWYCVDYFWLEMYYFIIVHLYTYIQQTQYYYLDEPFTSRGFLEYGYLCSVWSIMTYIHASYRMNWISFAAEILHKYRHVSTRLNICIIWSY